MQPRGRGAASRAAESTGELELGDGTEPANDDDTSAADTDTTVGAAGESAADIANCIEANVKHSSKPGKPARGATK